ncbi:hypothetical protein J6590_015517 [Homalodisca vitripennis]|nr:hypothetical protein J6590_015517 [Homalodisca vitripennis]
MRYRNPPPTTTAQCQLRSRRYLEDFSLCAFSRYCVLYKMDPEEENRIARLLESVEKEVSENEVLRPFGGFRRELFNEIDEEEELYDGNDDVEDLDGILVPIGDDRAEQENDAVEELPHYVLDDTVDLENIPLKDRLENDVVIRANGRLAYISKDMKMLWDLQPTPQARTRARNILRMRDGHVGNYAKQARTPTEVWGLFFTEGMIVEIVENTNIWIEAHKERFVRERDCKPTTPAEIKGTPRLTKELICRILGVEMPQARRAPPPADIFTGRCFKCDWHKNRPSKTRCAKCQFFICKEHAAPAQCIDCVQGEEEMEVDDE